MPSPSNVRTPSRKRKTPSKTSKSYHDSNVQRRIGRNEELDENPILTSNLEVDHLISLPESSPSNVQGNTPLKDISDFDLSSPLNYGSSPLSSSRSGIRNTPIRQRPDISSGRRLRQLTVVGTPNQLDGTEAPPSYPESVTGAPQLVIWGTDVVINHAKSKFKLFILRFVDPNIAEDEHVDGMEVHDPLYIKKLEEIYLLEEPFLNLNCAHLDSFDSELCQQLINYPQEVIPTFDMAVNEMFFERYPDSILQHQIQVRPFNVKKTQNMRSLNPEVNGMVIRTSNIIPEMREAFFKCSMCCFSKVIELDQGRIEEPVVCSHCNVNHCFTLIHNRSQFSDRQIVKLQESPEDIPAGQTPHTVMLFAHSNLVDCVQPGDRVAVTGIYRAIPVRINPRQRIVKAIYHTHIDVVHFRRVDTHRLRDDVKGKEVYFTPERIQLLKELSSKRDIYERLARALAPAIYEHEDIKKGILLQLFGGTKKDFSSAGKTNFRSEINILLCGDPGTSKSQLLQYVYNLVPRSQYTSGKGSSAVGLTAYITKDPETSQLVLQTGALVLADNGVCCIDEFDKMNDMTRSVLHEVMEQQTLSIAKAGIICQLNARTSVLAAANPCESQWNKNKTTVENIQLPHTLLSRFDLIFLMLDPQNESYDRRLAKHLVSLYYKSKEQEEEEMLVRFNVSFFILTLMKDMAVLRDYISYAKQHIHPRLSDEASQRLITVYVDMRRTGSGHGHITAYPRQLESLIRLSEALAKVRFSEVVDIDDVEEAWRLYKEALKQAVIDPISGKIDISILTTGISSASRKRRNEIANSLKQLILKKGNITTVNLLKLYEDFKESSDLMITREMFEDALQDLQDDEFLLRAGRNARILQSQTHIF